MVATSTLKTKSSDCISDQVDRKYDQVCIEKGERAGYFSVFFLLLLLESSSCVLVYPCVLHGCSSGGEEGAGRVASTEDEVISTACVHNSTLLIMTNLTAHVQNKVK